MDYKAYSYIYPPRPEHKITPSIISKYDNGEYYGQPKYNGSCSVLFLDGKGFVKLMERHAKPFSFDNNKKAFDNIDFAAAHRGEGFMVLCGEYLTKNAKGENGKEFNRKFIIWDILVYNGKYLLDSTFEERMELLDELYPGQQLYFKHVIDTGIKGIYKSPVYKTGFEKLYSEISAIDLYEGFVFKRKNAKLELGLHGGNNSLWQVKCRKGTKNYKH